MDRMSRRCLSDPPSALTRWTRSSAGVCKELGRGLGFNLLVRRVYQSVIHSFTA